MKLNTGKILVMALVASITLACNTYNKVLKGKDDEAKYTEAIKYFNARKYSRALALLNDISFKYAGTSREDSIMYYTATSHYKQGDFDMSAPIFDDFRRRFGRSPFLEDVEYMYAKGFYYASPVANRDQMDTRKALVAIEEYMNRYPKSIKTDELNRNIAELKQKLYDKSLLNAKVYYNMGAYNSAVVALRNALEEFPETTHREELMYLIVSANNLYAKHSMSQYQKDRYLVMMDAYYDFIAEFPNSKYIKQVEKMHEDGKNFLEKK